MKLLRNNVLNVIAFNLMIAWYKANHSKTPYFNFRREKDASLPTSLYLLLDEMAVNVLKPALWRLNLWQTQ